MRRTLALLIVLFGPPLNAAIVERVECRRDPTQTYALFLPPNYTEQTNHPVLFIFDPRSRGAMAAEIFRPAAERFGWIILSSNNTRSDGPDDPNTKAINAMWPELSRYAIDPKRIYASGFSGGGILTLLLGVSTGALAGVIDVGGRMPDELSLDKANFAHYGASGRFDFNFLEMGAVDAAFARLGLPHRLDRFDGTHGWLPQELATTAVTWLEVVAMQQKKRAIDQGLIDELYAQDLARRIARRGESLERFELMKRTFDGLREMGEVDEAIEKLRTGPELKRDRDLEQREARYEKSMLRAMVSASQALRAADPLPPPIAIRAAYRLDEITRNTRGPLADAAQRVLESIFTQTSFYLPRDFFDAGDAYRAAAVLEIARAIKPALPFVRVQLARAYVRTRQGAKAAAEIEAALANGLQDRESLRTDPDLKRLIGQNEKLRKLLE
ncbi:MAG: hypothetical protein JJE51_07695 [Thermoanaerobaculia bacterium]|nr:hypothetical protein [Thermoanaerobaculia bacterium]